MYLLPRVTFLTSYTLGGATAASLPLDGKVKGRWNQNSSAASAVEIASRPNDGNGPTATCWAADQQHGIDA